jgi:hypothetical protein
MKAEQIYPGADCGELFASEPDTEPELGHEHVTVALVDESNRRAFHGFSMNAQSEALVRRTKLLCE